VRCNQTAIVVLDGTITEHGKKRRARSAARRSAARATRRRATTRRVGLPTRAVSLRAGEAVTLHFPLPAVALRDLRRHVRESATFTLSATSAGGSATTRATIPSLKLGRKHRRR
jgi:hypothetical protein